MKERTTERRTRQAAVSFPDPISQILFSVTPNDPVRTPDVPRVSGTTRVTPRSPKNSRDHLDVSER